MTKLRIRITAANPVVVVLIGGWQYRWVSDDAYIDFRVVHNILQGLGPVFNPGERLEVYTDPLWVGVLTAFSGLFSFLSVEWWSVILGLLFTGFGFWLEGLATTSLASKHCDRPVLPLGILCVSVVAGVWMFATSGLETGLIFGWLGLSSWLLVRAFQNNGNGVFIAGIILSLGFTIRPDMALFTLSEGVTLFILLLRRGQGRSPVGAKRIIGLLVALTGIPILSELFRIAYFGQGSAFGGDFG